MTTTSSLSNSVSSVHHRQGKGVGRWIVLAILLVFLAGTLFPFFLAAFNAIKTPSDYAANGPLAFPQSFDLTALKNFWATVDFPGSSSTASLSVDAQPYWLSSSACSTPMPSASGGCVAGRPCWFSC